MGESTVESNNNNNKNTLWDDNAKSVNEQLLDVWKSASISTLSSRFIRAMLDNYHSKCNSLMKD